MESEKAKEIYRSIGPMTGGLSQNENPINPAGVEGAGEAPPRRRLSQTIEVPGFVEYLLSQLLPAIPGVQFRIIKNEDMKNVICWQVDEKLYFMSWHDAPPSLEEVQEMEVQTSGTD